MQLLLEDPVLLDQVGNHILLMPMDPAGNRQQEQLQRERSGRHPAIVGALKSHVGGRLRTDPFSVQDGPAGTGTGFRHGSASTSSTPRWRIPSGRRGSWPGS